MFEWNSIKLPLPNNGILTLFLLIQKALCNSLFSLLFRFVNQVESSKYMSVYFILPLRFSEEHDNSYDIHAILE